MPGDHRLTDAVINTSFAGRSKHEETNLLPRDMPGTHSARGRKHTLLGMPVKDAARLYQAGAARNAASGNPSKFRIRVLSRDNSCPRLEKRKSPRRKMVLPVKVSIDSVTHLAHTIDIADVTSQHSYRTARLCLTRELFPQEGALFTIAWRGFRFN